LRQSLLYSCLCESWVAVTAGTSHQLSRIGPTRQGHRASKRFTSWHYKLPNVFPSGHRERVIKVTQSVLNGWRDLPVNTGTIPE
jgi:hypothetical protein